MRCLSADMWTAGLFGSNDTSFMDITIQISEPCLHLLVQKFKLACRYLDRMVLSKLQEEQMRTKQQGTAEEKRRRAHTAKSIAVCYTRA